MAAVFATTYLFATVAFFVILGGVFWLVGRLGWLGTMLRVAVVGIAVLKALSLARLWPLA
jgi:hypothetical protein